MSEYWWTNLNEPRTFYAKKIFEIEPDSCMILFQSQSIPSFRHCLPTIQLAAAHRLKTTQHIIDVKGNRLLRSSMCDRSFKCLFQRILLLKDFIFKLHSYIQFIYFVSSSIHYIIKLKRHTYAAAKLDAKYRFRDDC